MKVWKKGLAALLTAAMTFTPVASGAGALAPLVAYAAEATTQEITGVGDAEVTITSDSFTTASNLDYTSATKAVTFKVVVK